MKAICGLAVAVTLAATVIAAARPLATAPNYAGKFLWIKLAGPPAGTLRSLGSARSIVIDLSFRRDLTLKKDKGGNQWFTFVVADQGSDWKWHQTNGAAGVPVSKGVIKAGHYSISVPVTGLPKSVLQSKQQSISLGPNTSGLTKPTSFTIDAISGR